MDYEQKYKEALGRAKSVKETYLNLGNTSAIAVLESIFPELKDSEDEIFKELLYNLIISNDYTPSSKEIFSIYGKTKEDCLTWLKKQGGQKSVDKVEQRFKVGDWIVEPREDKPDYLWYIDRINDDCYRYDVIKAGIKIAYADKECHLWTIQDAKDGDVLANKYGAIFINSGISRGGGTLNCYCYLSVQNEFCIEEHKAGSWFYKEDIKPATKEQRNLLFTKMKEAGYEWDAENKRLKHSRIQDSQEKQLHENAVRG